MPTQRLGAQHSSNPRVRACHCHRDPGPVADMSACRRKHFDCARPSALLHGRQVADHAAWPFGQGKLDRLVQILDHITELAGDLKDHHLTHDPCSDLRPDRLPWGGQGRAQDDRLVERTGKVVGRANWLRHG